MKIANRLCWTCALAFAIPVCAEENIDGNDLFVILATCESKKLNANQEQDCAAEALISACRERNEIEGDVRTCVLNWREDLQTWHAQRVEELGGPKRVHICPPPNGAYDPVCLQKGLDEQKAEQERRNRSTHAPCPADAPAECSH